MSKLPFSCRRPRTTGESRKERLPFRVAMWLHLVPHAPGVRASLELAGIAPTDRQGVQRRRLLGPRGPALVLLLPRTISRSRVPSRARQLLPIDQCHPRHHQCGAAGLLLQKSLAFLKINSCESRMPTAVEFSQLESLEPSGVVQRRWLRSLGFSTGPMTSMRDVPVEGAVDRDRSHDRRSRGIRLRLRRRLRVDLEDIAVAARVWSRVNGDWSRVLLRSRMPSRTGCGSRRVQ